MFTRKKNSKDDLIDQIEFEPGECLTRNEPEEPILPNLIAANEKMIVLPDFMRCHQSQLLCFTSWAFFFDFLFAGKDKHKTLQNHNNKLHSIAETNSTLQSSTLIQA